MKKIIFLSLTIALLYFSRIFEESNDLKINCHLPLDFPTWIKWDCDKQKAYELGNIYFNEDSTAFAFGEI